MTRYGGNRCSKNRLVTVGILGRFRCWPGCLRRTRRAACGVWWSPCTTGRRLWPDQDRVVRERLPSGLKRPERGIAPLPQKYWMDLIIHAVLEWVCSRHGRWFIGRDDRFERQSPQERHHEERSVSSCGFREWRDLEEQRPGGWPWGCGQRSEKTNHCLLPGCQNRTTALHACKVFGSLSRGMRLRALGMNSMTSAVNVCDTWAVDGMVGSGSTG